MYVFYMEVGSVTEDNVYIYTITIQIQYAVTILVIV